MMASSRQTGHCSTFKKHIFTLANSRNPTQYSCSKDGLECCEQTRDWLVFYIPVEMCCTTGFFLHLGWHSVPLPVESMSLCTCNISHLKNWTSLGGWVTPLLAVLSGSNAVPQSSKDKALNVFCTLNCLKNRKIRGYKKKTLFNIFSLKH